MTGLLLVSTRRISKALQESLDKALAAEEPMANPDTGSDVLTELQIDALREYLNTLHKTESFSQLLKKVETK